VPCGIRSYVILSAFRCVFSSLAKSVVESILYGRAEYYGMPSVVHMKVGHGWICMKDKLQALLNVINGLLNDT